MPRLRTCLLAFGGPLILSGLVSCGGDSGATIGPVSNDALLPFVGTWTATEFVHARQDDPSTTIDLIADGASFVVSITATGQYIGTIQVQTETRTETGTMRVVGSELVIQPISPPSAEERVRFVVSPTSMTWTGPSEYDFNADGLPTATNVRIVFSKG